MSVSCYTYANFHLNVQKKLISDLSASASTIKCALLADTYTPLQNRHDSWSAPTWAASTAYSVGDVVIPTTTNGHMYVCTAGGTSGASEPTWPTTDGATVTDNTATWECIANGDLAYHEISGTGYTSGGQEITTKSLNQSAGDTIFDGDNVLWSSSTLTARYAVIYDDTPAAVEDKKILAYLDFGGNKSTNSADFEIQWNANGIFKTTATQVV